MKSKFIILYREFGLRETDDVSILKEQKKIAQSSVIVYKRKGTLEGL
jgi:hypothetical protein